MLFRFIKYFRVSKEVFRHLLEKCEAKMRKAIGLTSVLPIIKLTAAIRFFAEGNYQKGVGNDYNVGLAQSTTSKCLSETINILENEICPTVISFPTSEEEKRNVKMGFFQKTGFPSILGCVDGTHVRIIAPSKDQQHLFYNRKGFHSLNVMLVSFAYKSKKLF